MRYFFDTEFIEDGKTIDLISIGIVAEDGRELYLGNQGCDFSKASPWVVDNVLTPLGIGTVGPVALRPDNSLFWKRKEVIAHEILEFVYASDLSPDPMPTPEFWAYYADYDWVVFCQLWGTMMMDLPPAFPMYCRDLKQEEDRLCVDLSSAVPQLNKHSALDDARWNKASWEYLQSLYPCRPPTDRTSINITAP